MEGSLLGKETSESRVVCQVWYQDRESPVRVEGLSLFGGRGTKGCRTTYIF